jgi:hypothetical protein
MRERATRRGHLQECCRSAHTFLFLILLSITSGLMEQGDLQECCRSAQGCLSCALEETRLEPREQGLQECCRSAHAFLFFIFR